MNTFLQEVSASVISEVSVISDDYKFFFFFLNNNPC